ncbi:glycoside hydrolase family 28 protein [Plebeiibacterium sediminum]|uniref:Glycosyl hydrolase family 28 protein n=1 Tax=Plebeiibacterium sediminum TaxID=2992112 RepID=A0AAE3M2K5_9BACT|nr:glycosyl hydrolase family 28 protein [Plebeiobacterium sediminum]MCW3785948.1 glycosyl hydrolase family 28 protein [Plebeiobacterium sediminum]
MKTTFYIYYILIISLSSCINQSSQNTKIPTLNEVGTCAVKDNIDPISAPFSMTQLEKPIFNNTSIDIKKQGATETEFSTSIIQNCIDSLSNSGGGTVIIPKGNWKSGRIILKSNINLHFEEGSELHFSGKLEDYQPAVFTRIEGIEVMSLGACIYANNATNIAITGKGKLFGPANGPVREYIYSKDVIENVVPLDIPANERRYSGTNGEGYFLPMFISPINCKNIFIEGITLRNTAFWNIVPIYCENIIIRGIDINSVGIPRGDGIDIESSKNVLIEYCNLSSGDDCFTMKAGRGIDGIKINKPTENVVVRYCLAKEGHGGITVGSETAGMIRNLYVHDCVFENTGVGIRFKTRRPRGGGGENLYYERIRMNLRYTAIKWDMLGSTGSVGELANRLPQREINKLTPKYRNITIKDITIENSTHLLKVIGIPESPVKNLTLNNINASSLNLINLCDIDGFKLINSNIKSQDSIINLTNAKSIHIENSVINTPSQYITIISDSISEQNVTINNSNKNIFKTITQ